MKYIFLILIASIISCKNEVKEIEQTEHVKVAEIFITNYRSGNIEEAIKYSSQKMNRRLITLSNNTKGSYIDSSFKFNYLRDSLLENKAYVFYLYKNEESKVFLIKSNSKWLVSYE